MTNDSYVSDDMSVLIDVTETEAWLSADDLAIGYLENKNEELPDVLSTEEQSKRSLANRFWYTARSLVTWREKARVKQEKIRFLEKKILDLIDSRENWKQRALHLLSEKQGRTDAPSRSKVVRSEASLKQTLLSLRE